MRICIVVNEFFGWGKFGGFGSAARLLATELASQGVDVSVVTPRRAGQPPVETVAGVTIYSYPVRSVGSQLAAYRTCDADIYHSQEATVSTYVAMRAMPDSYHVVTCRYTRTLKDLLLEMKAYVQEGRLKPMAGLLYENNPFVSAAVRRAQKVLCSARFLIPAAQRKYGLGVPPEFAPSPVQEPTARVVKAKQPTVCFLGRWDKRKRPEVFFELARQHPDVSFIAMGNAQGRRRDQGLRLRYGDIPNLEMTGFIDQFSSRRFEEILSRSWILVNTSELEGLPRAFLEAAFHECAILASVDPDGFASRFGYRVTDGNYSGGLQTLLNDSKWRGPGQAGTCPCRVDPRARSSGEPSPTGVRGAYATAISDHIGGFGNR